MNPKHLVLLIIFVIGALMVTSCAKKPEVGEPTEELPVLVEEEPVEEFPESLVVEEVPQEIEAPTVPVETYGYRVQIGAFMSQSNAELFAAAARTNLTGNVYVEQIPPWHKVRVGDLLSREEAEMLRAQVLQLGYPGSFIVETMVTPGL
ncbi:SPOR domain-containing protein [candidate division TA06 bacterium]|uniref:SPOR domain-containing protein n=1 Tax=candidate division TA06 bacterium TaxID=2250710 RepID=A0A523XQR4_UNCT6|nr:MAG: SPOR domain-containing protein [candidate division TA06 bacterium]